MRRPALRRRALVVIKIEKPPRDFARRYDAAAHGESTYFVWLNQGKESAVLDFKQTADMQLLRALVRRAGRVHPQSCSRAMERAGLRLEEVRKENRRLITCAISGYWRKQRLTRTCVRTTIWCKARWASAVTGNASGPAKVGMSICDISAERTRLHGDSRSALGTPSDRPRDATFPFTFESVADWMSVPFLSTVHGSGCERTASITRPSRRMAPTRPVMASP